MTLPRRLLIFLAVTISSSLLQAQMSKSYSERVRTNTRALFQSELDKHRKKIISREELHFKASPSGQQETYLFQPVLLADSLVLVKFYQCTNGENWIPVYPSHPWLVGPVCEWNGVKVKNGRVVEILMSSRNVEGELPPELGELTALERLYLGSNKLCGELPAELGNLQNLTHLLLDYNQLNGEIPSEWGQMSSIQLLSMRGNQLSGCLPESFRNLLSLEYLYLEKNQLAGNLPAVFSELYNLKTLMLDENLFSGCIPAEWGRLNHLENLYLGDNHLIGILPIEMGQMRSLEALWIWDTELEGDIPSDIIALPSLESLALCSSRFSGALPLVWPGSGKLQRIYLSDNDFTGLLPSAMMQLEDLTVILLDGNEFSGDLRSVLVPLEHLSMLALNGNKFHELPDLVPYFPNLMYLWLNNNNFTFEDLEQNTDFYVSEYSPQAPVLAPIDTIVYEGDDFVATSEVGGSQNHYQWYRDGKPVLGADNNLLTLTKVCLADSGEYVCVIVNDLCPDLTLSRQPVHVEVLPILTMSPAELDFNYVPPYHRRTITLSIQNTGQKPIQLDQMTIQGSTDFSLIQPPMPQLMPAGSVLNISIQFNPCSKGPKRGQIQFFVDGDSTAIRIIPLTGNTNCYHCLELSVPDSWRGTTSPLPGWYWHDPGDTVHIAALPAYAHNMQYRFKAWRGNVADSLSADTYVIMNQDQEVMAIFESEIYSVTVSVQPPESGQVRIEPDQAVYSHADTVFLEAVPNAGFEFMHWENYQGMIYDAAVWPLCMICDSTVIARFGTVSAVDQDQGIRPFALHPNYPNPFNPETIIPFVLDRSANVRLAVYNVRGQQVCGLVEGSLPAGSHHVVWKGCNDQGRFLDSGLYIIRMTCGNRSLSRKVMLIR